MDPKDILNKANHNDGMTVPDGYFADFNKMMAAKLPPIEFEKGEPRRVMPRTIWQKARPYVYMAAMFAGIWCMMKMFDIVRPSNADLSIDSHPAVMAAVNNEEFFNNYVATAVDEGELLDELYSEGFDTVDFEYE